MREKASSGGLFLLLCAFFILGPSQNNLCQHFQKADGTGRRKQLRLSPTQWQQWANRTSSNKVIKTDISGIAFSAAKWNIPSLNTQFQVTRFPQGLVFLSMFCEQAYDDSRQFLVMPHENRFPSCRNLPYTQLSHLGSVILTHYILFTDTWYIVIGFSMHVFMWFLQFSNKCRCAYMHIDINTST